MKDRGLNSFCRKMAAVWGVSYGDLFEEQRRLMASGALAVRPGKGPGSGVEFTPENLAVLLASFFAKRTAIETYWIATCARKFTGKGETA